MRLSNYIPLLLEKRRSEKGSEEKNFEPNEGLTSPPGTGSSEEIRVFMDYMKQANLIRITAAAPEKKKYYY